MNAPISTSIPPSQAIAEWRDVDARRFREEILPLNRPAVLRGVVRDWPVVREALRSPQHVCAYLKQFDSGADVNAIMTPPEAQGLVGYRDDMSGFTFVRNRLPMSAIIDQLLRYLGGGDRAPCVAAQSALISESLPGFLNENVLPLLDASVLPRIWLGNRITVPAHFDEAHNLAACVSGKRRFTLFPPEQVDNLYVGPLDFTPAGAPISMASRAQPDLARYPRYRDALAASQSAELEPGDAIYIPAIWWHQVESIGQLNVLINYWWGGSIGVNDRSISPTNALMHCLLNMKDLTPEVRLAWKAIFEHFVFDPDPQRLAHIPDARRGVLGELPPEAVRRIKDVLIAQLKQ
ncbi:cupin-like domain-containing protein [Rugamonas sp.]|uniref:cupin-like domain-containing protein n=1 Tax=Rugamonas sp. TaxID=1926287 RepID=UPI0025D225D0|nr:cupin-like domain-containing protein [Rugamonas sp.]